MPLGTLLLYSFLYVLEGSQCWESWWHSSCCQELLPLGHWCLCIMQENSPVKVSPIFSSRELQVHLSAQLQWLPSGNLKVWFNNHEHTYFFLYKVQGHCSFSAPSSRDMLAPRSGLSYYWKPHGSPDSPKAAGRARILLRPRERCFPIDNAV